ncbi:alanine/glycine:cation symporter family protein [Paramaledivibacter caminithermalis]|uniref:Alanine or glycine:cation symporter, AGCS family n=1 Tax=Paramaledivibacter caminithermalis (strain DSM 15212 / CIP 107654 / DViRD3) TaxID=1121301 RepID=A0A1M6R8D7_PARC5|nr:sodium:alanine symporter family protein [Paramaledivibacter caminithermalis]SHK28734.1 alanine or glycine:cation symporter, AGCS family [Paramaledivibacter caminithermalis DSM 15212]
MELLNAIIAKINSFAWGGLMIFFLVGTGFILTLGTRVVQFRKLGYAFKLLFSKDTQGEGDITPFQALMTSLAATIGTGNIAGVAGAIAAGGPGAVFWMWITAAFGGATKYAEALLAIKYRITNEKGEKSGGPMYYIKLGMTEKFGGNWSWLGWLFALFGTIAAFGIGNMVQANSVAQSIKTSIGLSPIISGAIIAAATALVILGGIKSIGRVTEKVVPFMAIIYVIGSLIILFKNAALIPTAFGMIFGNAFSAKAVGGGLVGTVIRYGVARGVFSNEAGLGSAPIAHAASQNNDPVRQGIIGSLGSFIDTLVICSMTAIVILVSGLVNIDPNTGFMTIVDDLSGAALTTKSFDIAFPGIGGMIVAFGLIFFAFSTILGWYYYGSKCLEYIAGVKAIEFYKWIWVALVFLGAIYKVDFVWSISDTFNGLMAIPNLIGLLALSPLVFAMTRDSEQKDQDNLAP